MFSTLDYVAGALATIMLLGPLSMAPAYEAPETSQGPAATTTGDPADPSTEGMGN